MSKKTERERLQRLLEMHQAAALQIACNREAVMLRIAAWDAQAAVTRRRFSLGESTDSRQQLLPFSAAQALSQTKKSRKFAPRS